jgi:hypothetical protein
MLLMANRRRLATTFGAFIGMAGALTLLQYLVGADFGFNHWLRFGRPWGHGATVSPGRMGPPASTSFLLFGIGLVIAARDRDMTPALRRLVPAAGGIVVTIATFSLIGYLFGARGFYAIPWLTAIALQTSVMLLALGIALIAVAPDQQPMRMLRANSAAGLLARRTLPLLIILPPLAGGCGRRGNGSAGTTPAPAAPSSSSR